MATIPRSQGPRVMPGGVRAQQFSPAEFGAGPAQAVEQLGNVAAQIGFDQRAVQMREEQRQLEEQRRLAEAAERAREQNHLNATKDALIDAHDEVVEGVRSGTIDKTQVESVWAERSKQITGEAMGGFREQTKPLVQGEIERVGLRLGNGVRKAVAAKDRHDITSSIEQTLEYTQRLYRTDPAAAERQAMATLDQLGPFSSYTPEQIAAKKQAWKEGTQYTTAFEAISAGRNDRRALDDAGKLVAGLPDLDPQRRAQLTDRIAAYRLHLDQKAELAAARAQREQERRLSRAAAEFETFQAMADKGTALSGEYVDRVVQATAGTPYQAGIRALAQQARETGGLAAQPVRAQQATLDAIDRQIAQQGRTPELTKRREQVAKVLDGAKGDLDKDALRAGLERGVITELQPLDLSGGLPGLAQQVQRRVQDAERVGQWAGRNVSPLTADEAEWVRDQMASLQPKDRAAWVATMAGAIGPKAAQGLAAQLDGKDRGMALAFSMAGDQTTAGRYTSELVLKGQQAKRDGTSTKADKAPEMTENRWKAFITAEIGDAFGSQKTVDDVRDAAVLISHGIAAEQGGSLSRDDMQRAVRLAVGGSIIEHAGRKIPIPAGVDEDAFRRRLETVKPEEVKAPGGKVLAGGVAMPVDEFVRSLPGQQLMPVSRGRYAVLVRGRPVINEAGDPVIIGVR